MSFFNNTNNTNPPSLFGVVSTGSLFGNPTNTSGTNAQKPPEPPSTSLFPTIVLPPKQDQNTSQARSLFPQSNNQTTVQKQEPKGGLFDKSGPSMFGTLGIKEPPKIDISVAVPPSGTTFSFFNTQPQSTQTNPSTSAAASLFGQKFATSNPNQNKQTSLFTNPTTFSTSLFPQTALDKKDAVPSTTPMTSLFPKVATPSVQPPESKSPAPSLNLTGGMNLQQSTSLFHNPITPGSTSLFPQFSTEKSQNKQPPKKEESSNPWFGKSIEVKPTQNKVDSMVPPTPTQIPTSLFGLKPAEEKPKPIQTINISLDDYTPPLLGQKSNILNSEGEKSQSLLFNPSKQNQQPSGASKSLFNNTSVFLADPKPAAKVDQTVPSSSQIPGMKLITSKMVESAPVATNPIGESKPIKTSGDRRPSIEIKQKASDEKSFGSPSILNSKRSASPPEKQKQPKPKVTFAEPSNESAFSFSKKTSLVDVPSKPTNKVTNVEQSKLVGKREEVQQFLSCKEIIRKISQSQNNKEQLKQFIVQKQVKDILSFVNHQSFSLNGQNFKISEKAMPQYQQTHINLKRYVFDLICYFKTITKYSDWKCLNIVENFFSETKYYDEFRLNSLSADENYFYSRKVYEVGVDESIVLSTFSSEVKKVIQMLIDQELIMMTYVCESLRIIDGAFTRGEISKIFNKEEFIGKCFEYYFKMLNRLKSENSKEELSVYFKSKLKHQASVFSKFILDFIATSQINDTIPEPLLKQIVSEFDSYSLQSSVVDTLINHLGDVQKNHQHILLALFSFDRVKRNQSSLFEKYPSLDQSIKGTKSYTLLPFREIVDYRKMMMEESSRDNQVFEKVSVRKDYKSILLHIDGPQWMHWMELYLKEQKVSNDEYSSIVNAMDLIYTSNQSLLELFRVNKFDDKVHPIFKHIEELKKNRNHHILYRLYRILLGNEQINHSDQVVTKHIRDKEWSEYLLKPLLSKFKEAAHNQVVLTEDTDDTDSKATFLFKIIQLNPSNLIAYSRKIFRNAGFPIQLITFLLDCFNYYTLNITKNYKIASHIFSAFNKLLINHNTYKDLLYAISLYHAMNSTDNRTHWLLRFLPDLKRDHSASALTLKKLIGNHLEILLNYQEILLIAPESSDVNYQNYVEVFKQRYSLKDLWENLKTNRVPGSPWVRSVSNILDDKPLNYRAIGNIARLLSYKSSQSYINEVPYLNLIKDILNDLPIAENVFQYIESLAGQSLSIVNSRKQMYDTLRGNSQRRVQTIQDGLYLLHVLLDLLNGVTRLFSSTKYPSYYHNLINDLKCFQGVQTAIGSYFNSIHEDKQTHPFVNLFGFINYQKQRLLPLTNNPTLHKEHYCEYLLPSQLKNKKAESLDYNHLLSPLCPPINKEYTSLESVSINILKVLTVVLKIHKTKINLNEYFKRSVGSGILQTILNLLYESLMDFQNNREECISSLQFLCYATKYQYKFVESFLISNNSFFTFLDAFLKSSCNDISILQKSIQVVNFIQKSFFRKIVNDKLRQRDYKQLFLNKLKLFDKSGVKKIENLHLQNNSTEILDRIVINRTILDYGRYYYSIEMLIEMTFVSIFKGHKPVQYMQCLFSFLIQKGLLSTANEWRLIYSNEINRVSQNNLNKIEYPKSYYFQSNNIFNHIGNYRDDPYQTHILNAIYEEEDMYQHLKAYSNNIYSFMKDITLGCYRSIYDIFIFIMNCGDEGYYMSTQPSNIKSDSIQSQVYCQFHQPRILFSFKDIYGKNESKIYNFFQSVVKALVLDLNKINPKCNYKLCLQFLSVYIHTLRSNPEINPNFKYSLQQLIEKPNWINDDQTSNEEYTQKSPVIINPLVSKIVLELITMIKQQKIKISPNTMKSFGELVSKSLTHRNQMSETKNNLLMVLLNLISLKVPINFNPIQLLSDQNTNYFYSVMRILMEYSKTHSLQLVQAGVINTLIHHPLLTSINEEPIFYTNSSRSESQMSWIWTLNLINHIVFFQGKNSLVANQILKFLEHFNLRILYILDEPSVQEFVPNYAFFQELDCVLKLLNISFRTMKNMSLFAKHFLERFQYCLLHNTIKVFSLLQSTHLVSTFTVSESKIKEIVPFKQTLKKSEPAQNLFSITLQQMLINCLNSYASTLEMSFIHSQFIKYYFEKPIQGSNTLYSNYFWLFTNKNIYNLQQVIQNLFRIFREWDSNVLDSNEKVWKSPEMFSTNGYLTSIKSYSNLDGLIDNLLKSSIMLSRMSLIYHRQQSIYRQKYLSLVPEDIEDFRSQQVKFLKNIENSYRKRDQKFSKILFVLRQQFTNAVSSELVYI